MDTKELERSFSFTVRGLNTMLDAVDDPAFQAQDAEKIIGTLKDQMQVVPFCEYLKRYVYLRSGMVGSYRDVPLEEYRDTICDTFSATGTPASMKHLETRLSSRVGSWLQQDLVRRDVVLLLGFGLSMPPEDVNEFLIKAIHEHGLDTEDPMEAICSYCYEHHYGFLKMQQLVQVLREAEGGAESRSLTARNQPTGREASRQVAEEDERLIWSILAGKEKKALTSRQAQLIQHFHDLYELAENLIIEMKHREKKRPKQRKTNIRNTRNMPREQDYGDKKRYYADIEEVLYASVPKEKHGNLLALTNSSLLEVLAGKRLSRQRLSRLMNGEEEPTRYDLMTLSFLIYAKTKIQMDAKERSFKFMEDTNRVLVDCGFGEMYPADPYECFLMMCMLSMEPLGTFNDVLEMSYEHSGNKGAGGSEQNG